MWRPSSRQALIYSFVLQPEGFKELDLKPGSTYSDNNCLRWNGDSKVEAWKTPELVWFKDEFNEDSDIDGDFLKFHGGAPALSTKAHTILQPLLKDSAEFLLVIVEGETRYLLNVTSVLDLMDKSKSTFKIYGDGQIGPCEYAYLNEPDIENTIFKVRGYLTRVFINEITKSQIENSGLTGVLIREYKNP